MANEQAWLAGTLGLWVTGLIDRVNQLRVWLDRGRPSSFWLAGFSNPQGFLTAVAQESTRAHASERWALDDVVYYSEVTDYERLEQIKQPPREGVLVHGLMLDGAAWNRPDGTLVEQEPKRLFAPSLPSTSRLQPKHTKRPEQHKTMDLTEPTKPQFIDTPEGLTSTTSSQCRSLPETIAHCIGRCEVSLCSARRISNSKRDSL